METTLNDYGLTVTESMTTPTRPGKQPRPVFIVSGIATGYEDAFRNAGGRKFRGQWSFWSDPTEEILSEIALTGKLSFADRQEAKAERAEARSERYTGYAENAEKRSDSADKTRRGISSLIPFGQPILVGHHSEGKHRRAIKRMNGLMGKSVKEGEKAEYFRDRAEIAKETASQEFTIRYVGNRIEECEVKIRRYGRNIITYADDAPYIERLKSFLIEQNERLEYWNVEFKRIGGDKYSPTTIKVGDSIKWIGSWYPVIRINKKTVSFQDDRFECKTPYHHLDGHKTL